MNTENVEEKNTKKSQNDIPPHYTSLPGEPRVKFADPHCAERNSTARSTLPCHVLQRFAKKKRWKTSTEPGKKNGRILSIKYWLFNSDPYNGL